MYNTYVYNIESAVMICVTKNYTSMILNHQHKILNVAECFGKAIDKIFVKNHMTVRVRSPCMIKKCTVV